MFKPQLKRATFDSYNSPFERSSKQLNKTQLITTFSRQKELSLVPQAFFQEYKNYFFRRTIPGLTGLINTCQYNYPKAIQDQITNENAGNLEFHQKIFSFYKDQHIYFWYYDQDDFTTPKKFMKHSFADKISAIYYKQVLHKDFNNKIIKLVAIAFGQVVRLFCLRNFQKQNNNSTPYLQDIMISIYSPQIVTNLNMIYQQSIDADPQKNYLLIVIGDANGNLILFDFNNKRKYLIDTIKQKIKRKIQKQSYSEITQLIIYKQFIFCLVNRHYEQNTTWKFIQKLLRNKKANITIQQKVQVYKIQLNSAYNSLYTGPIFTNSKITGFKKYGQYTTENIINKIKSSYNKYFEKSSNDQNQEDKNQLGFIESLTLKNGFVQIMFKSGQSILVDQDISFAEAPSNAVKKPINLSILTKNTSNQESLEKPVLLKSIGTKLMYYQGYLASVDKDCSYFTPFSSKENNFYIRSIKQYNWSSNIYGNNTKYLIFGHKNITFVQKINPKLVLYLYCAAMCQEFPYKKYIPQTKKFDEKIDKIFDYYGQTEVIIILLQFLMRIKLINDFKISIRIDLFELIAKQISTDQQLTYKEAVRCYEQNEKNLIKNLKLTVTKDIQSMIWRVIFKVQRVRIQLPRKNQWHLDSIQAICMALQVIISQIFKNIKFWTARNFCFHRNQTYLIISQAKILTEVIQDYLKKQAQGNSRKNIQYKNYFNLNLNGRGLTTFTQNSQSLKINFCELSKKTLQKLILLLKVYDYVCQMDLHGTQIPRFSDLLFNFDLVHRIKFSTTILKTLGINNQALIDNLILTLPQLHMQQVRKFNLWQSLHEKTNFNLQQNNKTLDSSSDGEIQQINQLINEVNYKQIQNYYLSIPKIPQISLPYQYMNQMKLKAFDRQKQQNIYFINGIIIMLRACLKKIIDLRSEQIKTSNAISTYSKANDDYYGVLEIPSFQRKVTGILKQIQFFTKCCEDLIERLFQRYSKHLINKQAIVTVLDAIRSQLTVQVRKKIQKCLERQRLTDLIQSVSKRQLFSTLKPRESLQPKNNYLAQQLSSDTIRKYQ